MMLMSIFKILVDLVLFLDHDDDLLVDDISLG